MLRSVSSALDGKGMQWAEEEEGGSNLGEELNELMETVVRMGPRGNSVRARRGDNTCIGKG